MGADLLTASDVLHRRAAAPRAAAIVVVAGIVWGLVAEGIRLRAGWSVWWVIGDFIPGVAFLACGYVAWVRRPDVRIGPLMIAIGFAWYIGTAATTGEHVVDRVMRGFQGWYDAFLAWLILAWPTGRLRWWASRIVVGTFFAVLAARTAFRLVMFRWTGDLDTSDAAAVERYIADVTLSDQGEAVFRILIAMLAVAVIVLVIARWRAETPAGRSIAAPILVGGLGFATGIIVETVALVGPDSFAERLVAWDVGHWLTVGTAAAIPLAFLLGLRSDRIARMRVADLVDDLAGGEPGGSDLRDVLATTLGDPSLAIVDGPDAPAVGSDRVVTPLVRGGSAIAYLVHDPALAERPGLMRSVAGAAALALENERLQAEVIARLEEVEASRARIVAAGDAERRRVERDLHDGAQQRLVTLALALQLARTSASATDPSLGDALDRASQELELALAELRELARGIHPTALVEDGLRTAIRGLAERCPVPVSVDVPDRRYPAPAESAAYFVVAEGLTNIAKYAQAASASVTARDDGTTLEVEVRDDGVGGADPRRGSGLQGLADRVSAIGGEIHVGSPSGNGTVVTARIPCG